MSLLAKTRPIATCTAAFALCLAPLQGNYSEVLYSNDFSSDTVGGKPIGWNHIRPTGANVGATQSFPIPFVIENGPLGVLIVGENTTPAPSLPGSEKSLRIYDYTSQGADPQAYLSQNFVVNPINDRQDVRLDFRFRRSTFIPQELDGDALIVTLGQYFEGRNFNSGANRAVDFRLANDGRWFAYGTPPEGVVGPLTGFYDGDGVNDFTLVANSDPEEPLTYQGPAGEHSLPPFTYAVYLNGARVVDSYGFSNLLQLGRFGFVSGINNAAGEIDFILDDIVVTGLREKPFVEFKLDYAEDFEELIVGEKPHGLGVWPTSANVGWDQHLPITSGTGAPIGVVVVGEEEEAGSPVGGIDGRSVRIYDYTTADRATFEHNFVPGDEFLAPHVKFEFTFQRSLSLPYTGAGQELYAVLAAYAPGRTTNVGQNRLANVRITMDGRIRAQGAGSSGPFTRYEPENELGAHHVTVFANSDLESATFTGPDGVTYSLDSYHFTTFLNGELMDENRAFTNPGPLGKFGFVAGDGNSRVDLDFVIDNIRVSDFSEIHEKMVPAVRIEHGSNPGSVRLVWNTENGITYRLQHSTDLINWSDIGQPVEGNGDETSYEANIGTDTRGFFRVSID